MAFVRHATVEIGEKVEFEEPQYAEDDDHSDEDGAVAAATTAANELAQAFPEDRLQVVISGDRRSLSATVSILPEE